MRRGFTLVELMLALALGGVVALMAHRLARTAALGARGLLQHGDAQQRRENGRRWLEEALLAVAVGQPDDAPFAGYADSLTCATWVPGRQGWPERVPMRVVRSAAGLQLVLGADTVAVGGVVADVHFEYLLEAAPSVHWGTGWSSPISAPLAVRIIERPLHGSPDTTVYLIGPRG